MRDVGRLMHVPREDNQWRAVVSTVKAAELLALLMYCLGEFGELRKAAISFVISIRMSVRPSIRTEQRYSNWTDFHEI